MSSFKQTLFLFLVLAPGSLQNHLRPPTVQLNNHFVGLPNRSEFSLPQILLKRFFSFFVYARKTKPPLDTRILGEDYSGPLFGFSPAFAACLHRRPGRQAPCRQVFSRPGNRGQTGGRISPEKRQPSQETLSGCCSVRLLSGAPNKSGSGPAGCEP